VPDSVPLLIVAWTLTYLIHSSALIAGALVVTRKRTRFAELVWRTAMFGGVFTALGQLAWLHFRGDPLPLDVAARPMLPAFVPSVVPVALTVWLAIAGVKLAALMRARHALRDALIRRVPLRDATIAERVRALSGARPVRVSVSSEIATPMVVGRRELCLPQRAVTELSSAELEAVLAHEIAHVRRHDMLWLSLTASLQRLLFIQPLNGHAVRRLRILAEYSCDDWALHCGESPVALASALTRVAAWLSAAVPGPIAVAMGSHDSLAVTRVRRVLDPTAERVDPRRRPINRALAAAVLVAVALILPGFAPEAVRYTIHARDDAGTFTVTLERRRVVAMTVGGAAVDASQLERAGDHVRVRGAGDRVGLDLTLTGRGGIRWTSRPPRSATTLAP
jgi:beta-lactamase regulating signal transducer with metallopeptidase domain